MRFLLLALALLLLAPAAEGRAAAPDKASARKWVAEGKRLLGMKKHAEALAAFEQAYRYWQRPEIQFNIALVYVDMGDKVAAATRLRVWLRTASPAEQKALPQPLRRLLEEVAVVKVDSPRPEAVIYVDGKRVGSGSAEVVVLPGTRAFELREGDRVLVRRELSVEAGGKLVWNPVILETRPVERVRPVTPAPRPRPFARRQRLHWAYFTATAVVAVVAAGALVGTGMKTLDLLDRWRAEPTRDVQREGRTYRNVTNALVGVSAAAATTAAILAVFTRWKGKERDTSVVLEPRLGPDLLGLSLGGGF
jgi:hypothetical protein